MKYRKQAGIWLTRNAIYVLKKQKSWYGKVQIQQACNYTCQHTWMKGGAHIQTVIHQLIETYHLQSWRITLLVGDTLLIWKKLTVPSNKKEEASQLAVWDESLGDGSRMYAFDVQWTENKQADGMYEWMLGAYPYDLVMDIIDTFEGHDCLVERIDVVPAAAGRLCPVGEGVLYLLAGEKEIHVIGLRHGVPLSYGITDQLPEEAVQWLQAEAQLPVSILWLDGPTQRWMHAPIRKFVKEQQTQWEIPWPTAVLIS